jgi:hypothetical protein
VSWAGNDGIGSGIRAYDLFVSIDGGNYAPWMMDITETSAVFVGEVGHTYAFYSVAIDNVGHVEVSPTTADTITFTVTLEPGDFNRDGYVSDSDFGVWRTSFGLVGTGLAADANLDGRVDSVDYVIWRKNSWHLVSESTGDYNHDGRIDKLDYNLWRSSFGASGANLPADGNHNGDVDATDYVLWRQRERSIIVPAQSTLASGSLQDEPSRDDGNRNPTRSNIPLVTDVALLSDSLSGVEYLTGPNSLLTANSSNFDSNYSPDGGLQTVNDISSPASRLLTNEAVLLRERAFAALATVPPTRSYTLEHRRGHYIEPRLLLAENVANRSLLQLTMRSNVAGEQPDRVPSRPSLHGLRKSKDEYEDIADAVFAEDSDAASQACSIRQALCRALIMSQ